jgi:ubiquinone/menaquinone biosynthesis C-methylase UbiE
MAHSDYNLREYWSRVGAEIGARPEGNVVAGDDNAYHRLKRQRFLSRFLHTIPFSGKVALEVGCGPGGNLAEIAQRHSPARLLGVDISPVMVGLAQRTVARHGVHAEVQQIDGTHLPFADRSIDLTYTVTVLQHNTDGPACVALIADICRVTGQTVICMEDIGTREMMDGFGRSHVARRVSAYEETFAQQGFRLSSCEFLNVKCSFRALQFSRRFWPDGHREGEPIGRLANEFLSAAIPITRVLDRLFPDTRNLAKMTFAR